MTSLQSQTLRPRSGQALAGSLVRGKVSRRIRGKVKAEVEVKTQVGLDLSLDLNLPVGVGPARSSDEAG